MTEILELSGQDFETGMINRLKVLMEKVVNMKEKIGKIGRAHVSTPVTQ